MIPRVAVLDYGCGNLGSVVNAVRKVGGEAQRCYLTGESDTTHVILPGQGSFRTAAARHPNDWYWLNQWRESGRPILGICLGMQLMCEGSEEAPGVQGLGWFPWRVERLKARRLPHIGWNHVVCHGDFYFCHSYAVRTDLILAAGSTEVEGDTFRAMVKQGNLWAVQFHPEKSGKAGLDLLAEFLKL